MSALQKAEIAKGEGQSWDKEEKEIKKEFFLLQAAVERGRSTLNSHNKCLIFCVLQLP